MPTTTIPPNSSGTPQPNHDFCAVVVLDPAGRVIGCNGTARGLAPAGMEPGTAFVSWFAFEVVSTDPEFLEAQWDGLLASALDRPTTLTLQPDATGNSRPVRVRLEKTEGGGPGYLATLQPPASAPARNDPVGGDDASAGLRLLADHSAVGFFELDLKHHAVRLSAAWKKMLGYAAAELPDTLESWRTLIHPDDTGAAPDQAGRKIPAGTRPLNVEFRMKHRRGHWVWIQCVGLQMLGAPGKVERVVGLHLDISERKELEDALVANDARLQDLSGAGPLAAFELDFAHEVFWFSPAWEKLLGYAEGELPATCDSFAAALPPEEASAGVTEWLLNRGPGQSAWVEPVKLRTKGGQPVPVILGVHRSVSRKRELLRAVGFACPLPAGAASEEGALPSRLVTTALDTLAEGVLLTDHRGKILFANAAATRLLPSGSAALVGQPLGDFFRLQNRLSGRPSEDPVDAALSADQPLPLIGADALAPAAEGAAPTPVVWTARAAYGTDGKPQGVVIAFRNPDEMTLTPEELVEANRLESINLLAGGIAHDFNNFLTPFLGAYARAKESKDVSLLPDLDKSYTTAKGLTKQLLAFAKGGSRVQIVCDPKELIQDALKIAAAASTAKIDEKYAEALENVRVDRAQVLQVFQNLVVNALQAMPPPPHRPRLEINVRTIGVAEGQVEGLAPGDYVEFEVRDNGSGIKPEHRAKIFDPFFTTKKHGTGLGLATVLRIVKKHGGQIGLVTEVGVGTAFTVYLPKAEAPIDVAPRGPIAVSPVRTNRILFMDDDPEIRTFTESLLKNLGYACDLAKTGEEAIALFKPWVNLGKPRYDAVIMDLTVIGGMGGEECFGKLRELDPNVRAIAATGYDDDDMRREFYAKGFLGYLTKPYRQRELGKLLKEIIG